MQFLILPQQPLKMMLIIKLVKIDSKMIILIPRSKSVKQSVLDIFLGLDHNKDHNIFDRFCIENTAYYVQLDNAESFLHAFFVLCIDINFKMKFKFFFPEIWEEKFGSVTHTNPSSVRSQSYKKYFLQLEKKSL